MPIYKLNGTTVSLSEKWVRVNVSDKGDPVEIFVTNSGAGIPAEIRKKILLLFFFAANLFPSNVVLASDSTPSPSPAVSSPTGTDASTDPKIFASQKLRTSGASDDFIRLVVSKYSDEDRDKIVELNVLGFLAHGDYGGHYSKRALKKCHQFMTRNSLSLRRAQKEYGVSKEVLTALLWVETKHGKTLGHTNVPQVYFSLLQADHPEVLKKTLAALEEKVPGNSSEFHDKAVKRSEEKAAWALLQLRALEEIYRRNSKRVSALNGSYAGAFGIPQFIPTSYLTWARTRRKKTTTPNLFSMDDAIESAAYYLHSNGWKEKDETSQRDALFHYNKSADYVKVILKIAAALREPSKPPRAVASEQN